MTDAARVGVGAACVIVDRRGRVLLVRHTYGRRNWELPGGGSEPDEPPDATALREVREETGLEVALEGLAGLYFEAGHASGAFLHVVFRARPLGDAPAVPSSAEIGQVAWVAPDALPSPISDFTERRMADALAGGPAVVATIEGRRWR
jgi:8-oxo-dGTP pyrophosphatase MutT (NUDIX family)